MYRTDMNRSENLAQQFEQMSITDRQGGLTTVLTDPSNLSRMIVAETRRRIRHANVPNVIFDVLEEQGFELSREPTVEEIKPMFVAAMCAAGADSKMKSRDTCCLEHLDQMTDSTGLIQHAIYSIPRRESGYTTDDNARALRLCVRLWNRNPNRALLRRITCYLSFLEHARCPVRGFHNFLSYQRDWLDATGTGDCQGQAVLALAEVLGSRLSEGFHSIAQELIESVLPAVKELRSLRAQAYVILAWGHLSQMRVAQLADLETVAWSASQRLVECYERSQRPDWTWYESQLTYANAVLPHALFVAARCWPKDGFLDVAVPSFAFLNEVTTAEGVFWPVGNQDWYPRGEDKALYDQQPVEASTMAEAALSAFDLIGDEDCLMTFHRANDWFHGQNSLKSPLADVHTGACCDGLKPNDVNRNQGAESTLAYLWTELLTREAAESNRIVDRLKMAGT